VSGIWKADLFLGTLDEQKWVGTTVKIQPSALEPARGLRVGIHPVKQGESDRPRKDPKRPSLVLCPLLHDGSFMELFYSGWILVQQFLEADAWLPREVALPRPAHRQVAKEMELRRDFPVVDIVNVFEPLAQPELLETKADQAEIVISGSAAPEVEAVVAPIARTI
jgi:hypothetical protein